MDADKLDDLDAAAEALLLVFEEVGVDALVIYRVGRQLIVRCTDADDVEWMCRKVAEQYTVPDGQKIN